MSYTSTSQSQTIWIFRRETVLLLGIILLAFAIRVYRLGFFPLHGDEAFAVIFTQHRLPDMIYYLKISGPDPHPPLYFLTLHFWQALAGSSEVAVRYPSLTLGILMIPLIYELGKRIFTVQGGLLAAFLAALNPFFVWYSQETRMYMMLATLSLLSVLLCLRALREDRVALWIGYVLATVLAISSHYFGLLILAVENGIFFLVKENWPLWRKWFLGQIAIVLIYTPWALSVASFLLAHSKDWIRPVGLLAMLRQVLVVYSLGVTVPGVLGLVLSLPFVLLFLLGLLTSWWEEWRSGLVLSLYLGLPLLGVFFISLQRPIFHERYLILIVPAYLVTLAKGISAVRSFPIVTSFVKARLSSLTLRLPMAVSLALLVVSSLYSLFNYFYVPQYVKSPPWPALAHLIEETGQEGDVIIYNYPDPSPVYYNDGRLPILLLPTDFPLDVKGTTDSLNQLLADNRRIWLVPHKADNWDADGFVETWLDRHADKVRQEAIDSLRLNLYLTPQTFLGLMQSVEADFGHQVRLLGYRLGGDEMAVDAYSLKMEPGQVLPLTLYWQATASMEVDYTVFTHLLQEGNGLWGQKDNQPVGGSYPTSQWTVGEMVVDKYDILVSSEAPKGKYLLEVGLYDLVTGERLPVLDQEGQVMDDRVILVELEIE